MSFIRVGKPGGGIRRKRSGVKKKPAWDDTIQDLSVHKASAEDQMYRKAIHESKNSLKARLERIENNQKKGKRPKHTARQIAVMKEILYDQQQLHDVLSRSDRMLSVVHDIFGDQPKRFTGFPSVTTAPGVADPKQNGGLVSPDPDIHSQLEALSQSIMDGTALNESTDEDDTDEELPEPLVYQPRLNLDRFHQFLAAAQEQNGTLSTINGEGPVTISNVAGPSHSTKLPEASTVTQGSADGSLFETPPRKPDSQMPKSAANDTGKINRSKKSVTSEPNLSLQAPLSLEDLKQVLMSLQREIVELEQQTGIKQGTDSVNGDSFSGYTMALVDSVTRLTRHLKETERRLQAEMIVREQLAQDVFQLRTVVDALTSDIILTQEEYARVVTEFDSYKAETRNELKNVKGLLHKLLSGVEVPVNLATDQLVSFPDEVSPPTELLTPPKQPQQNQEAEIEDGDNTGVVPRSLIHPDDVLQPAVLLSPPVQRTRLPERKPENSSCQATKTSGRPETGDKNADVGSTVKPHAQPPDVVNVPRPVPLVQTNIPFDYLHRQMSEQNEQQIRSSVVTAVPQMSVKANQPSALSTQPIRMGKSSSHSQQPITVSQSSFHSSQSVNGKPTTAASHQPSLNVAPKFGHSGSAFKVVNGQNLATTDNQQQNLRYSYSDEGSRQQNGVSGPDAVPSATSGLENPVLAAQIAELNRQHEEAQRRLQFMLQQQHALRQNVDVLQKPQNAAQFSANANMKQTNSIHVTEAVSPDVSPISERSSSIRGGLPANQKPAQNPSSQSVVRKPQSITVSVPTVELDLSQFSDVSPSPQIDTFS